MKCADIEIAVAEHFNPRINLIVPNIHWGFGVHECDLLIVSKSGYATEIEIKVSMSDLKNDASKKHGHENNKIKYLYFAVPENLRDCLEYIPERAGLIIVKDDIRVHRTSSYSSGKPVRPCEIIKEAQMCGNYRLNTDEQFQITRLGTMRIWTLKQKIQNLIKINQ